MSNPIKIWEIKGEDFAKGLSYFNDFAFGGYFSEATFDPFEDYGYFTPPLASVVTDSSLTSTPKFITTWAESGTAKLYVHTNDKLYEVLDGSPYTTTNESAEIVVTHPVVGATIFQGKYIYVDNVDAKIYSNTLPVASASNTELLSGFASSSHYKPLCVAPDKNLYMGDFGQISRITNVNGTSGNTGQYYNLEDYMTVRDMASDGQYLIVIADNNQSHTISADGKTGSYRCQVLFYDVNNGRPTADFIHEFTDSYLTSVKVLDGAVYIFGKDNFWVCNSQTKPKAIFSFQSGSTITEPPRNFFEVAQKNNTLLWCGVTNGKIYAYGSKLSGQKKVFYNPYGVSSQARTLNFSGEKVYVGTNGSNQMLLVLNTGSTRTDTSISTVPLQLPNNFKFAFAKVVLKRKLASGESVGFGLTSQDSDAKISTFTTKTYAEIGAKQTVIFNVANDPANSVKSFSDMAVLISSESAVAKVQIFGYPIEDYEQQV